MLSEGVDVNGRNSNGNTGLHTAMQRNRMDIVRLLLAHTDIQIDITDSDGKTAEMVARQRGNHDCARLVREYLETENKPEEVDDVLRMVEMIKSGETTGEGPTRLEEMTLTEVAKGIEKINADQPIIEAANSRFTYNFYHQL